MRWVQILASFQMKIILELKAQTQMTDQIKSWALKIWVMWRRLN